EHKIQGKILLESSWELEIAELLDEKNIRWCRPSPIEWVDSSGQSHLYYPDFYIKDTSTYLDPKNPFCMQQDTEKMDVISSMCNIIYGDINKIKNYINSIWV